MQYIPIDFIKSKIVGLSPEHFFENPLFENPETKFRGELLATTTFRYKNLRIVIYDNNNRIEFYGSLHTFYNNGKHNYNDFGPRQFKRALQLLDKTLGIRPENLYLMRLEWGFNLETPFDVRYLLDGLIQHSSVNKTVSIDCTWEGHYIQFKHSTYRLKVYDKGLHFDLNKKLLRVEISQHNWSACRRLGIVTLLDFIRTDKRTFLRELINQWERVILYDIDNKKTDKYMKYQTSTYWDERRKNYSNKNFKYHQDKLKELNQTHGKNVQGIITSLILEKGNNLQL